MHNESRKGGYMIVRRGIALGKLLYHHQVIEENQIDDIRYALEIIMSEFLEIAVIIGYCIISKTYVETLAFLLCFQSLRSEYEGYHAKTILRCFVITITVYLSILSFHSYINIGMYMVMIIFIIMKQLQYYLNDKKKRPITVAMIYHLAGILLYQLGYASIFQILSLTQFIVILSYILERRAYER